MRFYVAADTNDRWVGHITRPGQWRSLCGCSTYSRYRYDQRADVDKTHGEVRHCKTCDRVAKQRGLSVEAIPCDR